MKKRLLIFILLFGVFSPVFAKHVTGGEMFYEFISQSGSVKTYKITLRLFRDDYADFANPPGAQLPQSLTIGIFNNDNNAKIPGGGANNDWDISISNGSLGEAVPNNALPPCIVNDPNLHYHVGLYTFTIDLPDNNLGYTAVYQTCCRIDGITNTINSTGASYLANIPGASTLASTEHDSSPKFVTAISVVCQAKPFKLDYSATDADGDSLVYSLCDAYGGGAADAAGFADPAPPPYASIVYQGGTSGSLPMGTGVSINSATGIISGIAPSAGKYVVSVCVDSYRNGKYISTHRKDFIVTVSDCDLPGAKLVTPYYINCDSSTVHFTDLIVSPLNLTFDWDFGDPASGPNNFSNLPDASHTYSDTGIFYVKLVVNKGSPCADSAVSPVRIYPGFAPGFKQNSPICKNVAVQFTDLTTTKYGVVNTWRWDFGVQNISTDVSTLKNPTYTYTTAGDYTASLIVSTNNGCIDTLLQQVSILDKPPFDIAPHDTLICSIDTLKLIATAGSAGTITWSPNYNINNVNSFTPLVSPDVTTTYKVKFTDNFGCVANDSVKVNVVNTVSLQALNDTTICRTDSVILKLNTDALYFLWTPAATLNDPTIKSPTALPTAASTTYKVVASISNKCSATRNITIKTVPYPLAFAGLDTSICSGKSAQLHASGGSIYSWSPTTFLSNPNISNPISQTPADNIRYIVTVRDTLGCPKPKTDTMYVFVIKIYADAGPRDTSVVLGQPLQLTGTGSTFYLWTPSIWLNNANISNPISLPQDNIQYVLKAYDINGCFGLDTIDVKLYKVKPDLYVPSAFSPGTDGINDIFRPIALGIKSLESFRVYNRWGQLVYSTSQIGDGWNGKLGGVDQATGTFVWYAEATDYLGNKIKKKGNVILIR